MRYELTWDRTGQVWQHSFQGQEETYTVLRSEREPEPWIYKHHMMVTQPSGSVCYAEAIEDLAPNLERELGEYVRRQPFEKRITWTRIS